MSLNDPDLPKPKPMVSIGQDLSFMGAQELDERIEALKAEIDRTEAEKQKRQSTRAAADAIFKF